MEVCIKYIASKDTDTKNNLTSKSCCGSNHYFSLTSNSPFLPEHRKNFPSQPPCGKMRPCVLFMKCKQKRHTSFPVYAIPTLLPFLRDLKANIFQMVELDDGRTSINLDPQVTKRSRITPNLLPPNPQHGVDVTV